MRLEAGQRVLTNDLEFGTLVRRNPDGWHDVVLDSGRQSTYDESRMCPADEGERRFGLTDPKGRG